MAASEEVLRQRLSSTQEAFDTEWKSWPDPSNDIGKAIIAKACMALRNNNGGFLILGIDNKGSCVNDNVPTDIQARYHSDEIQGIVSKFSSDAFEVHVHFVERENHLCVMIDIPSGVKTPVFSKSNLPKSESENNKVGDLMRTNTAYVRNLSNGTVSTAPATATDWPRLMGICFDNREADIGAFARRQLSGIDTENLVNALQSVLTKVKVPTPKERLNPYLDEMYSRFVVARDNHNPQPPKTGTRESASIILGDFTHPELSQQFMFKFLQIPQYSGWPPFVELTRRDFSLGRVKYVDKGLESFEYVHNTFSVLDFSRMNESGQFYFVEAFSDDLRGEAKPKETLEFVDETSRVAETIAICLAFAKEFCGSDSSNDLAFAFRWRELNGRQLCSWMDQRRGARAYGTKADQNEIVEYVTMPVATSTSAIGQYVEAVVRPVFRLFGGWEFQSSVIQDIVTERLSGR